MNVIIAAEPVQLVHATLADKIVERFAGLLKEIAQDAARGICSLQGHVRIERRNQRGTLVQVEEGHNVICTVGKNKMLASAGGEGITAFQYISIGTGATAETAADVTLQTEVARLITVLSNPAANTFQALVTFPAGNPVAAEAIVEAGLFDAAGANAGNMLSHKTFAANNKATTDTLGITWSIN